MRLQIVSDVHLEFAPDWYPPKTGNAIALCGDIGWPHTQEYQSLLRRLGGDYEFVFVVPGNHEYYRRQKTMEHTRALLHDFCAGVPNVHLLDNAHLVHEGVRYVGTTLWSALDLVTGTDAQRLMSDYRQIRKRGRVGFEGAYRKVDIGWRDTNEWHRVAVAHLERQLDEARAAGERVVVLTHHCPTLDPRTRLTGTASDPAYATDLPWLLRAPVVLWAYGHTHRAADFTIDNGVRVVSNPRGYPSESDTTGFRADAVVEI